MQSRMYRAISYKRLLTSCRRPVQTETAVSSFSYRAVQRTVIAPAGLSASTCPRFFHSSRYSAALSTVPLEPLGDSITTATIVTWHKKAGDAVSVDDPIATVDTDKVSVDIKAKNAGVFGQGLVDAGAEIEVGANLYTIDIDAAAPASAPASSPVASSSPTSAPSSEPAPASAHAAPGDKMSVPVPAMGESITTGSIASWTVKVGDFVNVDDVVAVIDTDKVTVDVKSPVAGTISGIHAEAGSEVEVGANLFDIVQGGTSAKKAPPAKAAEAPKAAVAAAPAKAAEAKKVTPDPKTSSASVAPASAPGDRSETRVKMTRMRLRIAQRLKEAQGTAAMLTTFQECDMGALIEMRNKYKDQFEKVHGVKLGFMSAFVKAATMALQEVPAINAMIDDSTSEIVYRNYCDISVAVASPTGLVVPVLRNTETMNFADVEKNIAMYGKKAKDGSLSLEEMSGGSFTISNGGVFGSLFGTPIINPPQSAILGMHATKMRAMVVDGKVEARPMMYLALTYDHRLIDGREAVTFLKSVAGKIEDPSRLLLNL